MTLLLIYASLSIFFSFLCSILEAVLLSITPTFITIKKQEGRKFATTLEKLKKDIDKPLIAILTVNTIAHTVGAILVGVQAESLDFKFYILGINTVGIVSAIMTLLILVVSEIIPKTIGANYWQQLSNFASKALVALIFPLKWSGILWLLQLTTKLIGGKSGHGSVLSREDFHAMTDIAQEVGVFEKNESAIIKNLLTFKQVQVKDIMTPRTVMVRSSEDISIQEFFDSHPKLQFSRIPIYKDNSDNITGFILKDELMEEIINGNGSKKLKEIKREILITNRNLPIPDLFEKFITQREHIALVVDEYGTTSGLVSMEDVIETLLGLEIMDESDNVADLQHLARKNWEARAKKIGLIKKFNQEDEEEHF
jgi:CBS domain containing-hemolysin-like protein